MRERDHRAPCQADQHGRDRRSIPGHYVQMPWPTSNRALEGSGALGHLSSGTPGHGSTSVHEGGFYPVAPPLPTPGHISALRSVDDTLDRWAALLPLRRQNASDMASLICQAFSYSGNWRRSKRCPTKPLSLQATSMAVIWESEWLEFSGWPRRLHLWLLASVQPCGFHGGSQ